MEKEMTVKSEGAIVPIEQQRAIQEVQASMIISKKFPRDQDAAYLRILKSCERRKLAENATYTYPRGGMTITGPSIRLAEIMAQNWGNLDFGITELSRDREASEVQAYCWDMETNVRETKTFKVPHIRYSKKKGNTKLTDPRDIYENVANLGARRLRACILGIIPGDIQDAAVEKCEETLSRGDERPLEDRIRDMLKKFDDVGVTKAMIEDRLQHKTTAIVMTQLIELGKIYNSIKDGMSKRNDWFDMPTVHTSEESEELTDKIKGKTKEDDEGETEPDLRCDKVGCDFIAKSERGLAKHKTQQHSKKEETKEEDKSSDSDETGERKSIIGKIRDEYGTDHIARAKAALHIPKMALESLSLDLLLVVQEKCETLKNNP